MVAILGAARRLSSPARPRSASGCSAPLSAALGSVVLWHAGEALLPGRNAGLLAAALLNATLLFGVGAVGMTPDTPLLFFWACCLWALACFVREGERCMAGRGGRVCRSRAGEQIHRRPFVSAASSCGCWSTPPLRRWLLHPAPWWGALFGALGVRAGDRLEPGAQMAGSAKQGGRMGDWQPARAVQFLVELLGSQFGLATPLVFVLCAAGIVLAARLAWRPRDPPGRCSPPSPSRPSPYSCSTPSAIASRATGRQSSIRPLRSLRIGCEQPIWRRLRAPAVALGLAITLLVYVQAVAAPFALPARIDPTALRLGGWSGLAAQVEAARTRVSARFVAADAGTDYRPSWPGWIPGTPVIGVGAGWTLFDLPRPQTAGQVGILVRSERRGGDIDRGPWADIQEIGEAVRQRDGLVMERYRLFRVVARRQNAGEAVLPGRHGNNPSLAQGVVAPSGRG